ncbi:leucine-rich repeat domain-containing protein [Polaribacter aestuariivivens]|uniref:leucine-rich repeat domain-containing protein n=1 Tax=Polaribacter aestuariivivens TaxID=2304626 RepID=UPI003F499427
MKTKLLFLFLAFFLVVKTNAQTTVTDDAFETYLETHDAAGLVVPVGDPNSLGDGTDGNDLVTTTKINVVTKLYLTFLNIEDLTGLEDFTALEDFQFLGNNVNVASVNLPALANLKKIYLGNFPNLSSIDVSNLNNLEDATFQSLSALASADLSSNTKLVKLNISGSVGLSTLNIIGLTSLEEVLLTNSAMISSLDFSTLSSLKKLNLQQFTSLTTLNVSGLSSLEEISTSSLSAMVSLDLSTLTGLKTVVLSNNNSLTTLNLKTGTTATIDFVQLLGNPMLTCVEVDAGIPINGLANWHQNNGAIFNEDCSNPQTYVPDDNFEAFLEANSMGNGIANDDKVTTSNINSVVTLDISNQSISDLTGIADFDSLTELNANGNTITTVDVAKNTILEKLYLNSNSLINIDISKNTALKELWINQNNIKNLDVSKNLSLEWLDCSNNSIEFLDLNSNTALQKFTLNNNDLRGLNIQNGYTVSSFDARNNANLTCIQVADVSFWTGNYGSQIDTQTSFSLNCSYPETNIPDTVFENYLETHDRNGGIVALGDVNSMGNGVANDQKVFTHKINTVTTLDVSSLGLADITGLEDFRDLEIFGGLFTSMITNIDFSSNLKLKRISLGFNAALSAVTFGNLPNLEYIQLGYDLITNLDLSGLPNLEEFKNLSGSLTAVDVSSNINLEILTIPNNQINNLVISNNVNLKNLTLTGNQLTSIDISNQPNLEILDVASNQLTSLDISNNSKLKSVSLKGNLITTLGTSTAVDLEYLIASNNKLKNLDLSQNSKLISLLVDNNELESLNLNNGNNSALLGSFPNVSNIAFDIRNNVNLNCVEVSDLAYANTNWTNKDPQTSFSLDCSATWSVMTAPSTTSALLAIVPAIDTSGDGTISIAEAAAYTGTLDLSGTGITDIEGLQAFTGITTLNISGNGITDLSPLTGSTFSVISKRTGKIKKIHKTVAMSLEVIVLSNNNFEVLDLNSFTSLTSLDISNNSNLKTVSFQNGNNANITSFNAVNTPNLSCILVDDVNATYLSTWTKDSKSEFVANEAECRAKILSTEQLDVSKNTFVFPNPIKNKLSINLNNSLVLQKVEVYSVQGKKIKVTKSDLIDFTNFASGIYLVKIFTDNGITTKRVVKE